LKHFVKIHASNRNSQLAIIEDNAIFISIGIQSAKTAPHKARVSDLRRKQLVIDRDVGE